MATKKFTKDDVTKLTKQIKDAVEKQKKENKNENFTSVNEEDIARKLGRVNSPMIVSQGWNNTTPGGTVNITIGLFNPDPTSASSLYLHAWVGSGNVDPVTGSFLNNVDPRFPRLAQPKFFGLTLAAGASASISFAIKVPANVEKTVYLGNSCLMQIDYHDIGKYLDRSCFPFEVA